MNPSNHAYLLLFLCVLLTSELSAQWESLDGPYGGNIRDLDQNDQYQYAATADGLFRSSDAAIWNKLTFVQGRHHDCSFISVMDSVIVASVTDRTHGSNDKQFFLSKNNGDTWTEINKPPALVLPRLHLTLYGIYVEDLNELWFSPDDGQTWTISAYPGPHNEIYTAILVDNNLWLGARGAIWKSSSSDFNWSSISIPGNNAQLHKVFVHDSVTLAHAPNNYTLFRSTNNGQSWTWEVNEAWGNSVYVNFARLNDIYFASLDDIILRSDDQGMTWIPAPSQFYDTGLDMVSYNNSLLFAGFKQGVIRSDDNGQTCYSSSNGITAANVSHIVVKDGSVIASCNYHGFFNLDQAGQEWKSDYDDSLFNEYVFDLVVFDTSFFITSNSHHPYVYRYSQVDQRWIDVSTSPDHSYTEFSFLEDTLLVITNGGLARWKAETQNWEAYTFDTEGESIQPSLITNNDQYVFAGKDNHVFRKNKFAGHWETTLLTDSLFGLEQHWIHELQIVGDKLFLLMVAYHDSQEYRILVSSDNGASWQFVEANFPELNFPWWAGLGPIYDVHDVVVTHGDGYSLGVVISGTDHIYWEAFNEGLPTRAVNDITFDDTYIYVATAGNGVWRRKLSDLLETNISTNVSNVGLTVFPNPSTGEFFFNMDLASPEMGTISYTDISGKTVVARSQLINPGLNKVHLHINQPGPGILSIQTSTDLKIAKVVLQGR